MGAALAGQLLCFSNELILSSGIGTDIASMGPQPNSNVEGLAEAHILAAIASSVLMDISLDTATTQILRSIQMTNLALENSKVALRFRLSRVVTFDYPDESAHTYGQHLELVRGRSDGVLDEVHAPGIARREIVAAFLADSSECGWSVLDAPDVSSAFVVVNLRCAVLELALAHEIGHLFGARHNVVDARQNGVRSAFRGYVDASRCIGTIMSVPSCRGYLRKPYYSVFPSPPGSPFVLGSAAEHNVAALIQARRHRFAVVRK